MAPKRVGRVRSPRSYADTTQFLGSGGVEARAEFARTVAFANLDLTDDFPFADLRLELQSHPLRGHRVRTAADGRDLGFLPLRGGSADAASQAAYEALGISGYPPGELSFSPDYAASRSTVDSGHRVCACAKFVEEIGLVIGALASDPASVSAALSGPHRRPQKFPTFPRERDAQGGGYAGLPVPRPPLGYATFTVGRALSGLRTRQSVRDAQRLVREVLDGLIAAEPTVKPLADAADEMRVAIRVLSLDLGAALDAQTSKGKRHDRGQVWTTFQPAPGVDSLLFGIILAVREGLLHRLFRCKFRNCPRYGIARNDRKERDYCGPKCNAAAAGERRKKGAGDPKEREQSRKDTAMHRGRRATWAKLERDIVEAVKEEARARGPKESAAAKAKADVAIANATKRIPKLFPRDSPARRRAAAFLKGFGERS